MNRSPDPRDVDARNRDFLHYEQVEKRQDYRLAESVEDQEHGEAFDETFLIKTISMASDPAVFSQELGTAMEEIGFCILTDHGIDPALYEEAEQRVQAMIGGLPLADKLPFRAERHGSVNQGYFPIEQTSDIHPDLVEGWVFCRRAFDLNRDAGYDANRFWPDPTQEPFFRRLCQEHEQLILPLMRAVLRYLSCDPELFDARLTETNFALRMNYYPPVDTDAPTGAGRLLGHEDVTLFTMLPAPTIEGLQVLNRANMRWVRLTPPPGSLVLNTGDYMQRLTNDRLPSTTHRVSRPRAASDQQRARVSFPMNIYLWEDETLEVLPNCGEAKYEPVRAEDFHTRITSKYYGDDYRTGS